jgi:hypothetical protein
VDKSSEAAQVQQRTIDSIFAARDYAAGQVDVILIAKVDPAEFDYFRSEMSQFPATVVAPLTKTSADLGIQFNIPRKLPILDDVINLHGLLPQDCFAETSKDYLIITNMDICLQPFFYAEVARILGAGADCFAINRRTLDKGLLYRDMSESYTAHGKRHPGHDCFVVPLSILGSFILKTHILGIGLVFRPFLLNCILRSRNFHEFDDAHLTFHYGDDMDWDSDKYADYSGCNWNSLIEVYNGSENLIRAATADQRCWLAKFFNSDFFPKFYDVA